jgi:hypothetical protein
MANQIIIQLTSAISGAPGDMLYIDKQSGSAYVVPSVVLEKVIEKKLGSFVNGHTPKRVAGLSKAENFRNDVYKMICARPGILGGEIGEKLLGPHYKKKYWKVNGALDHLRQAGFVSMERNGRGFAYSPKKTLQITHEKSQ